ncbi:far upstream element-binding protein 2 isoform X2 [Jatropha curcas]|uniref:far upstream element-binding protein 2 isoform X2 n=1 Tax=Jatropha curcas TaxID=180498 RepID=UPI0005FBFC88|nr:far upstream element-binding protein 2 isoform X2 [Jatropha curcas]
MAEEEVVPLTASPVPSDHKRKLEDLEPEAPEPVESNPEQPADSSAEPDADKKADDAAVEDGGSPDTKRPRLDENKPDGLASENGFEGEKSEQRAKEEAEEPIIKNEETDDASPPQPEGVTDTIVNDEATGHEHETVDTRETSFEDSKPDDDEKKEENLSLEAEETASETQTTSRKMDVPNDKVGVLIGKGGDTIRYLQYNSGAKIQITRDADADPHSTTRPVEIIGTLSNISKAEKLISAVIAEADAGGSPSLVARGLPSAQTAVVADQLEMQVPNEKVGLIIGRGGDTIKALQAKSGARIQLIPQHLPEGDGSKERTVRVTGDRKQIEMAREMIKDVMNQNVRPSHYSGAYNQQQSYRPRGPPGPSHWGPRGPHSSQQSPYDYHHRGPYPSQNSQYPPPSYGGYPPQQMAPRGNYGSGWEQRHPPSMQGPGPHGGGYDYYGGQAGHASDHTASGPMSGHGPGPSPTPAMSHPPSQPNYNYGQSHGLDYGHQAPYSQGVPPQSYGHVYDEPKYDNHGQTQHPYGHGSSQQVYPQSSNQPGYGAQQQYGKQPSYGMPSQGPPPQSYGPPRPSQPGDMPYQGPIQSGQSYGPNVPPQQQYPYASSGPVQQSYTQYGSTSAADGYNQAMPASGPGYTQQVGQPVPSYGQPSGQQATGYVQGPSGGYGSYPSSQQGYPEQPAQNNAAYGYQGSQDPAYGSGTASAYSAPQSGQQAYAQPAPTQPSYDQSVPQSGAYAAAPGSAPVGYGKTVSPQPTYPQYDSTQMYVAPR